MWFIGVEVGQETSAPPPKKNPGSAPANNVGRASSIFSEFQLSTRSGEGKMTENFEKDALFCEGTRKLQKIMNTALLSQGIVHDCNLGRGQVTVEGKTRTP